MKRYLSNFILLVSLILSLSIWPGNINAFEPYQLRSFYWVHDHADLLTDSEEKELSQILANYSKKTTIQLIAVTIDKPANETIEEFSLKYANSFKPGLPGLNNGALIFLAIKVRKIRIELGYGLEWPIDDKNAQLIVNKMIPFLKRSEYYDALKVGFNSMIDLTKNLSWIVSYSSLTDALNDGESAIGKIIKFRGRIVKSRGKTIIVNSEGKNLRLNITVHMESLVKNIETYGTGALITARVKRIQPFELNLMGVN